MRITDFIMQDKLVGDRVILQTESFPVNMRLYNTSTQYRDVIQTMIGYMTNILNSKFEDHGRLRGISGPAAGIPFNIIVCKINGKLETLINPTIVMRSKEKIPTSTNCTSLMLKKRIKVERSAWISVKYYTLGGEVQKLNKIDKEAGGFVLQHEIDHTLGNLIVKNEKV